MDEFAEKPFWKMAVGRFSKAAIVFFALLLPAWAAAQPYYYLQVASFRAEERADRLVAQLGTLGYAATIVYTQVPGLGYWHRVYVGPYDSRPGLESGLPLLRDKKILKGPTIIVKKTALLTDVRATKSAPPAQPQPSAESPKPPSDAKRPATVVEAPAPSRSLKLVPPPKAVEVPVTAPPPQAPPPAPAPVVAAPATPPMDAPMVKTVLPSGLSGGFGRNLSAGTIGVGFRHTYLDMDTEITNRRLVTSAGSSEQKLTTSIKHGFPVSFHTDTLQVRYGLTDITEIYGDLGATWDAESVEPRHIIGLGIRQNLYQTVLLDFWDIHIAVLAEYHNGKFETSYKDDAGDRWNKSSDWQALNVKLESGFTFDPFILYGGISYLDFREDTTRKRLENIPTGLKFYQYEDEVEEKRAWGLYGGGEYHLSEHSVLNLEAGLFNQKRVFASYEYHF